MHTLYFKGNMLVVIYNIIGIVCQQLSLLTTFGTPVVPKLCQRLGSFLEIHKSLVHLRIPEELVLISAEESTPIIITGQINLSTRVKPEGTKEEKFTFLPVVLYELLQKVLPTSGVGLSTWLPPTCANMASLVYTVLHQGSLPRRLQAESVDYQT